MIQRDYLARLCLALLALLSGGHSLPTSRRYDHVRQVNTPCRWRRRGEVRSTRDGRQGVHMSASVVDLYQEALTTAPLATKASTSAVLFGLGDTIAQFQLAAATNSELSLDKERLAKYCFTGFGSGIVWSAWYDSSESLVAHFSHLAVTRTALALLFEQFFWCPIVFSLYLIPMSSILNGGLSSVSRVYPGELKRRLPGLLVANAKVWTLANIIIYNLPVQYRVVASNVVDIVWSSICSDVAADCGGDDDSCAVSLPSIVERSTGSNSEPLASASTDARF